jgi:predicted N-acetyltransferase YhbS
MGIDGMPIEGDDKGAKERLPVTTRPYRPEDRDAVEAILREWVKNPDTGEPIEEEIRDILDTRMSAYEYSYVVAEVNGEVVGIGGYRPLPTDSPMWLYAETSHPAELNNGYVRSDVRAGQGVGTAIHEARWKMAKQQGHTEVLFNSGPRYKDSGHGFHTKTYGPPVGVLKDFYGAGNDAPVWRKKL